MLDINPVIKIRHSFKLNFRGCIIGTYQGLHGFCSLCVKICFHIQHLFLPNKIKTSYDWSSQLTTFYMFILLNWFISDDALNVCVKLRSFWFGSSLTSLIFPLIGGALFVITPLIVVQGSSCSFVVSYIHMHTHIQKCFCVLTLKDIQVPNNIACVITQT
jgi:hypothetical protein